MTEEILSIAVRMLFHLVIWGAIIGVVWDHVAQMRSSESRIAQRRRAQTRASAERALLVATMMEKRRVGALSAPASSAPSYDMPMATRGCNRGKAAKEQYELPLAKAA